MKGIASLFFIVAIFLNCHDNSFSQTQRNPVLEFCTGNWCPWCPCGHAIVEQIESSMPNAIFLGYHGPANGSDPFSYFSGNSIISSIGLTGYPTGTIDRVSGIQSRGAWTGLMNTRNSVPATVLIDIDATFNPITRGFTATINLTALTNLSGQFKFNAVLLEDGIVWSQAGNGSCSGSSHYIHNNVVRDMINGALGEEIVNGNWNESEVITKTVNRTIPSPGGTGPDMIWDNCSVVILVYKVGSPLASNSEIQQAKIYSLINLSVLLGVNSPQGGESWPIGSNQTITWTSNNVEVVKIEYTTDGGISWITVVDSIQNNGSYDWTIPNTISNNCKVKISDVANSSVYDESDGSFTIFLVESNVNEGWNIVSIPLHQLDMSVSFLFPNAISPAYDYNGGYNGVDTLKNAVGYWIKFDSTEVIPFRGNQVDSNIIAVNNGWNMIGPFEENIPVNLITSTPRGIIASNIFGFEDGYYIADTLEAGKGYWVSVTSDGVINLNGGLLKKNGEEEQIATKVNKEWGKIKITDNEGKSITLLAAEEEIESGLYELPPMPPTGIFDARYNSGRLVENVSSEKIIQISSNNYPIKIKAEGISLQIRDMIDGKILDAILNNGEELLITNDKIKSIEVTRRITKGLPVTYQLYQNYPNPFNPSTTIKFAVPKESIVNLSIYNVLGELVSTLVNEEKIPGYYEYEFDASSIASGVYLYRIKAGDFVETKKMILMK